MRLLTCTAIAAALVLSATACQQQESATGNEAASTEAAAGDLTALNGTWKTDKASVKFEQKPDDILPVFPGAATSYRSHLISHLTTR